MAVNANGVLVEIGIAHITPSVSKTLAVNGCGIIISTATTSKGVIYVPGISDLIIDSQGVHERIDAKGYHYIFDSQGIHEVINAKS